MSSSIQSRRLRSVTLGVTAAAALIASACSSSKPTTTPTTTTHHDTAPASSVVPDAAEAVELARARAATARYATDLAAAKADGYRIITPMMPDMGYHFLNPAIAGLRRREATHPRLPPDRGAWQLGALEWVFPEKPATPPLAECDLRHVRRRLPLRRRHVRRSPTPRRAAPQRALTPARRSCSGTRHSSRCTSGSGTPTPDGLFSGTNPLVTPFNQGAVQQASLAAGRERWKQTHGA